MWPDLQKKYSEEIIIDDWRLYNFQVLVKSHQVNFIMVLAQFYYLTICAYLLFVPSPCLLVFGLLTDNLFSLRSCFESLVLWQFYSVA